MTPAIQLLIADENKIYRTGLHHLLNELDSYRVLASVASLTDLLDAHSENQGDVLIMDTNLLLLHQNSAVVEKLFRIHPGAKVIGLAKQMNATICNDLIAKGIKGVVFYHYCIQDIETAIKTVYNGNLYYSQEILQSLIEKNKMKTSEMPVNLTCRELEVLNLISVGLSNQQIADRLLISSKTVNIHRTNLLAKTKTNNTATLIMFGIKHQLL